MRILALVALLLIVPAGKAQEKQAHPGYPPTLLLASASEQDGKVVVQIARPGPVPAEVGKEKPGERPMTEWVPLRKVTVGDTVQAFTVDGKPVEPKAVLKALAKAKGVGVFMRSYANDLLTPPAFYRDLFREGTLLLVVKPEDLYNPKP